MQPEPLNFVNPAKGLATLSQQRATGELILSSKGHQWHLYLLLGRLLCATGETHRVRRWRRAITQDCPNWKFEEHNLNLKKDEPWEHDLLKLGIDQNQLTLTQAKSIIDKIVDEVLFDLVGHSNLNSCWLPKKRQPIALVDVKLSLQTAIEQRNRWQSMGLGQVSPDAAPIVKQPNFENFKVSKNFLGIIGLVNGENTIWDIASQLRQDVTTVTSNIQHLVNQGILELLSVPDLPLRERLTNSKPLSLMHDKKYSYTQSTPATNTQTHFTRQSKVAFATDAIPLSTQSAIVLNQDRRNPQSDFAASLVSIPCEAASPRIAYIDDNRNDGLKMSLILKQAGYQCINVQEAVEALPILLEYKPSLIFLDLIMPIANGYEICTQIRRVSSLKKTPVIILTSNDGIVDRVRARMVGSSDFLAKPITTDKVLKILQKYLPMTRAVASPSQQILEV